MPFLSILASQIGSCLIKENIMNNRFKFAHQLKSLGLNYNIKNDMILIHKSNCLNLSNNNYVCSATDLRGGMAILFLFYAYN